MPFGRRWNAEKMIEQYIKYRKWRVANDIDSILERPATLKLDVLSQLVPSSFHGFDKEGRPIYVEKSGSIHVDALLANCTDDEIFWAHVFSQENQCRRAREKSEELKRPIETFTMIMDLKGLTMNHKRLMRFTEVVSKFDAEHYPERMGSLFIVNPPWIFPALYAIVKAFLDPVTKAKIHVLSGDPRAVLLEHIDADQLPIEYGGACTLNDCKAQATATCCVPQRDISHLLEELHKREASLTLEMEQVPSRSKVAKVLPGNPGTTFSWYFKTASHDIGFECYFQPEGTEAKEARQMISNMARYSTDKIAVQGEFTAREKGTCHLIFDNSHSFFTSKQLSFLFKAEEPSSEIASLVQSDEQKEVTDTSAEPAAKAIPSATVATEEASNAATVAAEAAPGATETAQH